MSRPLCGARSPERTRNGLHIVALDLRRDRALKNWKRDDQPVLTFRPQEYTLQTGQGSAGYLNQLTCGAEGPWAYPGALRGQTLYSVDVVLVDRLGDVPSSNNVHECGDREHPVQLLAVEFREDIAWKKGKGIGLDPIGPLRACLVKGQEMNNTPLSQPACHYLFTFCSNAERIPQRLRTTLVLHTATILLKANASDAQCTGVHDALKWWP